jgi:DNA-binding NarL/FixJ family response regulator
MKGTGLLIDIVSDSPVTVFLVVENRLLREALARLFRKRTDLLVVGQGGCDDSTRRELLAASCDVLVIDFFDPRWLPERMARETAGFRPFKSVLIGMGGDEEQFLEAVRSGVVGYLLKEACASDVISAVKAAMRLEATCPPRLCHALFQFVAQIAEQAQSQSAQPRLDLTLRQLQLVELVAKGLTNKEIAARLNLSEFTVRNHIHRILKQTDVGSRHEAVQAVRAQGYSMSS